jgi:hypothetical protein
MGNRKFHRRRRFTAGPARSSEPGSDLGAPKTIMCDTALSGRFRTVRPRDSARTRHTDDVYTRNDTSEAQNLDPVSRLHSSLSTLESSWRMMPKQSEHDTTSPSPALLEAFLSSRSTNLRARAKATTRLYSCTCPPADDNRDTPERTANFGRLIRQLHHVPCSQRIERSVRARLFPRLKRSRGRRQCDTCDPAAYDSVRLRRKG